MSKAKFPLFSADVATRLAWLRERQGVTLGALGEGSPSTAQSWEKGKMPRRERWHGISERLGVSEMLIFFGRPDTAADYEFIAKWRNDIEGADEKLLEHERTPLFPGVSQASAQEHVSSAAGGSAAEVIKAEIRRDVEEALLATKDDPKRLGWLAEQVKEHLAIPRNWRTAEEINQRARELAAERAAARAPAAPARHLPTPRIGRSA